MKDTIPVCLLHLCVYIVTGVTQLRNLFRQQLDAVNGVAENDALVDFKL